MTLLETIRTIENVALQQASINTVVENDVFKLNDMPDVKYAVFAFTQGQHTSTTSGDFTTYGFSLFYVDRLNEDRSNQVQIQSTGERTLRNILLILADAGIDASQYTVQPFNQRFADECAGVYCDVQLTVQNEGTCPDWVPAMPPHDILSREELEKALTKSTIRTDRYQQFTTEEQTRALENAGADIVVLDELPAGTVISSELGNQLADCAAIVVKVAPEDGGSQLFRRVKSATVDGAQVTTFEALADERSVYVVAIRVDATTLVSTTTVETVQLGSGDGGGSLPAGGTTGQVLTKTSDEDGAVAWRDVPGNGGGTDRPFPLPYVEIEMNGDRYNMEISRAKYDSEIAPSPIVILKNLTMNRNYPNQTVMLFKSPISNDFHYGFYNNQALMQLAWDEVNGGLEVSKIPLSIQ